MSKKNNRSSFQELVQGRRSIRRYIEKPVERDRILVCLEAARLAPSADNAQPWRFLVLDDEDLKKQLCDEVFSGIYSVTKFAKKAPVLIVILARLNVITHRIGKQIQNIHFHLLDIGIAGEHIVLQAEELGLGTCWIGWFNARRARKVLKIPREYKIVSLLSMGYYEQKPSKLKKRRELDEIVWFNEIGRKID
jgi:nitroreductase